MAANKNQHFVPKCYFRPFTLNGHGSAINLYNLKNQKLIRNAPVKKQCSRDYFYGKNPKFEHLLQSLESDYSEIVRRLIENSCQMQPKDYSFLSSFWTFQHLRTETAQQGVIKHSLEVQNAIGQEVPELNINKQDAILLALSAFSKSSDVISDLNFVLIKNGSSTPFLTSDNPAILTNRLALYGHRKTDATFGMHSAGAIAILPITPKLLVMMYDKDVYSVQHQNNTIIIRNDADIKSLNEQQHLNCASNLYLDPSFTEEHIRDFPDLQAQRKLTGPRLHVFQKEHSEDHRYIATQSFDRSKSTEAIFAVSNYYAKPTCWPEFLRWRNGGFYFSNGSGVGPTRRARINPAISSISFRKTYTGH